MKVKNHDLFTSNLLLDIKPIIFTDLRPSHNDAYERILICSSSFHGGIQATCEIQLWVFGTSHCVSKTNSVTSENTAEILL